MIQANLYEDLREKVQTWAKSREGKAAQFVEHVLILPDLMYLLGSLILDPAVKPAQKAKLGMAMAYVLSPLDLIPEGLLGPIGYTDDVALIAFVLNQLLNHVDETIVKKHWKGKGAILEKIRHIVQVADEMVGTKVWHKLKILVGKKTKPED